MLNNLYRKLHILFASSVMLIITLVISFVVANTVHTEKNQRKHLVSKIDNLADLSSGKCFFGYG